MKPDAPANVESRLRVRWRGLCTSVRLRGDFDAAWQRLDAGYSQSWRAYHNWTHVAEMLHRLDERAALAASPPLVELAIYFHDGIYEIGRSDNESRSAEFSRECLASLGASVALADRVAHLVEATDHMRSPHDNDARLLCDIDLAILGSDAQTYDAYADAIFREVGVPADEFGPHRVAFLSGMLSKDHIFHTKVFRETVEAAARAHMQRERARWSAAR